MSEPWVDTLLGDDDVRPEFAARLRSRVLSSAERRRRSGWPLAVAASLLVVTGGATAVAFTLRRDTGRPVQVEPSTGLTSPPVSMSPVPTATTSIANTEPSTTVRSTAERPTTATAPPPSVTAPELSASSVPATEAASGPAPAAPTDTNAGSSPAATSGVVDLQAGTVFGLAASSSHDSASAVELITRSLGVPTSDVTEMTARYCPEPAPFRVVRWNDLVLVFGGSGNNEYLSSWQLGDPAQGAAVDPIEPRASSGVSTSDGIGIGSPSSALDRFAPIDVGAGELIINGRVEAVAVTVRDGVVVGLWSGPWDWDCGSEPR